MNRVLAHERVLPLYGQISLQSPGTVDLPEWVTGEEPALATEHAAVIATQSDADGDVEVSIVEGTSSEPGALVLDTELSLPDGVLEFGSIVASALHRVPLTTRGYVRVRVYVDPPGMARSVAVVLDPGAAP